MSFHDACTRCFLFLVGILGIVVGHPQLSLGRFFVPFLEAIAASIGIPNFVLAFSPISLNSPSSGLMKKKDASQLSGTVELRFLEGPLLHSQSLSCF